LSHRDWNGDVVLRVNVEARGATQVLRLTVEQWPQRMPAALESLRTVLQSARLTLELDFPHQEPV
ncbi:MAG: hypothetical protein OEZ59_13235, partial [Deltaproteobacteria bacterium]|nr:hypothetical protein [Deltaproteobacteria bacterium]